MCIMLKNAQACRNKISSDRLIFDLLIKAKRGITAQCVPPKVRNNPMRIVCELRSILPKASLRRVKANDNFCIN